MNRAENIAVLGPIASQCSRITQSAFAASALAASAFAASPLPVGFFDVAIRIVVFFGEGFAHGKNYVKCGILAVRSFGHRCCSIDSLQALPQLFVLP